MAIKFQGDKCRDLLGVCEIIIVALLWLGLLALIIASFQEGGGWANFFLFMAGFLAIFFLMSLPFIVIPWSSSARKFWNKYPKFSKGLAITIVLSHYLVMVIIYSLQIYYNVVNNKIVAEGGQADFQPSINLAIAFSVFHGLILCILIIWKIIGHTLDIDALSEDQSKSKEKEKSRVEEMP